MIKDEPWPEDGIIRSSRLNNYVDIQLLVSLSNHITVSIGKNQHPGSFLVWQRDSNEVDNISKNEIDKLIMILVFFPTVLQVLNKNWL